MAQKRFVGLVLAAGKGTRFAKQAGPQMPKVLRPLLGKPMIQWVIDTLVHAGVTDITIVVGFSGDEIRRELGSGFRYVVQREQSGSGNAVASAVECFAGFEGGLVVMCGDSPLFEPGTIREMMRRHEEAGAVVTLASAVLGEPSGYGRIVRSPEGEIVGIVEEKCATASERSLSEVNGGAYVFDARWLFGNIDSMVRNETGEYNLTDMVRVAVEQGRTVAAAPCSPEEIAGVNGPEELAAAEDVLEKRAAG